MTLRHYEPVAADCSRFSPGWSFTTDISEDMDCPECLAALESEGRGAGCDHDDPLAATARDTLPAGARRFFEMEVWEPRDHAGCTCLCCPTAQEILVKMLAHVCQVEPAEVV